MLTLNELSQYLNQHNIDFEIIAHNKPIISKMDAEGLFDIEKAAPVFILKTETYLFAFVLSSKRERIDFKLLRNALGCSKLSFADKKEVLDATGYEVGSIPLIGHGIPCILDSQLMNYDYIFGGTGDAFHTLKISPNDVLKLNCNAKIIDYSCSPD